MLNKVNSPKDYLYAIEKLLSVSYDLQTRIHDLRKMVDNDSILKMAHELLDNRSDIIDIDATIAMTDFSDIYVYHGTGPKEEAVQKAIDTTLMEKPYLVRPVD